MIGGRTRWEQRLAGLEREFEKQIAEAGVDDEPRRIRIERQRAQLKDLRSFALPLIDALGRLPVSGTWREWLDTLEGLAAMSLRDSAAVLSVLAELRPMADVGPVHLDEVREVLTHRLTFLREESTERRYGKVFVGSIMEAAGMSFDTVFVPGLGEGIFPQRSFEDPLLLDGDRAALAPCLTVRDTRVEQERLLFHTAAAAAEHRLFISYPRMTLAQERTRGPSFYALEVFRAIRGRIPDLQELQRTAAEASQLQAGWPAPRNSENAIDDAEYDLAVIHRLMHSSPDERRGGARYLLSENSNLARSLYWRSRRWRSKWTESDGLADADNPILAVLEEHRLAARPYSATALQQFAACPYRFFLYAILRLEPRAEALAIERMDPLTRGSLFIQFNSAFLVSCARPHSCPYVRVISSAFWKLRMPLSSAPQTNTGICCHPPLRASGTMKSRTCFGIFADGFENWNWHPRRTAGSPDGLNSASASELAMRAIRRVLPPKLSSPMVRGFVGPLTWSKKKTEQFALPITKPEKRRSPLPD